MEVTNEEYNYPEVAKHSYFIMPQFVQGRQKSAISHYSCTHNYNKRNSAILLPPFDTQTAMYYSSRRTEQSCNAVTTVTLYKYY